MTESDQRRLLRNQVEKRAKRLARAEHERQHWLAQTVYLGTLGLVFVIPLVAGAYLGAWLDGQLEGYSVRWTLSLLFVGLVVGLVNAYLMLRE